MLIRLKHANVSNSKSLSQRLFEIRLRLGILLLERDDKELKEYGQTLIDFLIQQAQALNTASFIVRQHWQYVEKFRDPHAWVNLSKLEIKEIFEHIAPLVVENDEDELAKRFDSMMFFLQVFVLEQDPKQLNIIGQVVSTAARLMKKGSIPSVASKMDTLKIIQESEFWSNTGILGIERVRTELRSIMKFLEPVNRPLIYTNFEDTFNDHVTEHSLIVGFNDLDAYRRKVEQYLKNKSNHLVIQKIRTSTPISTSDLNELEILLFEEGEMGSKKDLIDAYGDQPVGRLIRKILGMEANAAKQAFGEFLNDKLMNAKQIMFINKIIDAFIVNGIVDPTMLFDTPFTDIDTSGVSGVFDVKTASKLVDLVKQINKTAIAA